MRLRCIKDDKFIPGKKDFVVKSIFSINLTHLPGIVFHKQAETAENKDFHITKSLGDLMLFHCLLGSSGTYLSETNKIIKPLDRQCKVFCNITIVYTKSFNIKYVYLIG
jgi:hypothetical protein